MASTTQQPTRFTVWLYRSLALGSTLAVAMHTAPLMDQASITHSITLSRSDELFLAKSGVRRITSNARKSEQRRRRLKEHGALAALAECATRGDEQLTDAALHAVALLCEGDGEAVVRERGLRDALGAETCGGGCGAVWKALGLEQVAVAERREMIEKLHSGA